MGVWLIFIEIIIASIFSAGLIIAKNRGTGDENVIESIEWMLLLIIPIVASPMLVSEPTQKANLFLSLLIGGAIIWTVLMIKKNKKVEPEKKMKFFEGICGVFVGFISTGIGNYYVLINQIEPILKI